MKNKLIFLYCLVIGFLFSLNFVDAATAPELKIPLDCYYIQAPDGDRLDNYLNKTKSRVVRRKIFTDSSNPYNIRVLRQGSSDFQPAVISVTAMSGSGTSAKRTFITRRLLMSTTSYYQYPGGAGNANIVGGLTQPDANSYYVDINVYDCTNGVVIVEYEKL